jgi:hypothetical protein
VVAVPSYFSRLTVARDAIAIRSALSHAFMRTGDAAASAVIPRFGRALIVTMSEPSSAVASCVFACLLRMRRICAADESLEKCTV